MHPQFENPAATTLRPRLAETRDRHTVRRRRWLLGGLLAGLLVLPSHATDVFVERVIDGDTLVMVLDGNTVRLRLRDIDAPERREAWGAQSTVALARKVENRRIEVSITGADRYGRLVGTPFVEGRDIGLEMIAEGHATATDYAKPQYQSAHEKARRERLGMWAISNATPVESQTGGEIPSLTARGCDAAPTCGDLRRCSEARWFLNECGLTRLDGDGDGIPCEHLCRN